MKQKTWRRPPVPLAKAPLRPHIVKIRVFPGHCKRVSERGFERTASHTRKVCWVEKAYFKFSCVRIVRSSNDDRRKFVGPRERRRKKSLSLSVPSFVRSVDRKRKRAPRVPKEEENLRQGRTIHPCHKPSREL